MNRKRIAVLIASIDREYQQDFTSGLEAAGAACDMDLCIFNTQGHMNVAISSTSETGEGMIYSLPDLSSFDGVISLPATMGSEIASQKMYEAVRPLKEMGKPHISIDVPQDGAVTICFDDVISVEELTEHMIREHHAKRVAFVCGPRASSVSNARLEACRNVLERHGLTLDDSMVFEGEWTRIGGHHAAEQIIASGRLPDTIICANDDMALSVIECLTEQGIYVPKDVAVTGFDALREAVLRGMTTICRPIDRASRKAIEILKKWIDGEAPEEYTVTLSTIPIYGETCGCYQNHDHIMDKLRLLGTERWNMESILTRVSMFSSTMAGVGDEEEAYEKIREFAASWEIPELYLCVDPGICRETDAEEGQPDRMMLLYGIRNGREYPVRIFDRHELVPSLQERRTAPSCLVFCPLYYRDRDFGYMALRFGSVTGSALYSVLMLLNGALMSLYLQTNIKRYAATIQSMSVHDIMTGMLNRRGYMEQAPELLEQARAQRRAFVSISMDMDHMKQINDEHGHLMGDEAICRMGKALHVLEQYGVTPVHISGDEFVAYGIADRAEDAGKLVDLIHGELARNNREDPWICEISASIGVYAAVPAEGDTLDYFMTQADRAMYAVKRRKKGIR